MRFLTVAERELRAAARKKSTFLIRWLTAAGFFLLLIWVMWATDALKYQGRAHAAFIGFSVMVFIYCLIVGTVRTADCLSSERREGTLGLLFLTNLNSLEIIAGKLCSSAVPTVYALLSIIPMLGMPLLMGGVTLEDFWRTVLALLDAIFFSLAAGFVASVFCKRQFTAVALAMALVLVFGVGLFGVAAIVQQLHGPRFLVDGISAICPLYTLNAAEGARPFGKNHFWLSLASVAGLSVLGLGLVTWQLSRSWRDRPKSARAGSSSKSASPLNSISAGRIALRRRLLDINPFYWLAGRRTVSAPVFMCLAVGLVIITDYATVPYFAKIIPATPQLKSLVGSLLGWLFTGLAIHVLVLYYAAMISSQRLAEDKETGALELILSTPATERSISRGLWMAFARRMMFPALVAMLVHTFFLWQCLAMATLDPPGQFPPNSATPWEILRAVLFDEPIRGHALEWGFVFLVRVGLVMPAMLILVWFTLGWVARWLGLRMKHPGFAPLVSLALVFVPPVLLFSLLCYFADQSRMSRMPQQQLLPLMMWLAVGIGIAHCLLLTTWAAQRLRESFRETVIGRFESSRRRWLPGRRMIFQFALRGTAFAGALAVVVAGFYGCQSFRSRHAWTSFQAGLKQRGQSLDLAPWLPAPVPDNANFARAHAFQDIISARNRSARKLVDSLQSFNESAYNPPGQNKPDLTWILQDHAPLGKFAHWIDSKSLSGEDVENEAAAPVLLKLLQRHDETFRAIAAAAQLPSFQVATNRDARTVLQLRQDELQLMERLHFLFAIRAIARLETSDPAGAEEDLLTSLRLTRLAGQSPDLKSTTRVQFMLARSFQPLWEGLSAHKWNDPQLAAIQAELDRFNLLAAYTNAVHRVVLANIEMWKQIPDSNAQISLPAENGGITRYSGWQAQPRVWWYYNCIQLHRLGQNVIDEMDVPGERVWITADWTELNDLPLEQDAQQFLGQYLWQGITPALVAFAQTSLNQARIACALERYRLANGSYPPKLSQLIPRWLDHIPNDVASGQPMTYEPLKEGSYCLRGFGPNHVNDRTNSVSDDWLWAYPTNAPASAQSP